MPAIPASSSSPLHLDRIGQIAIHVSDVPAALAFYRDVLGLRFLFGAGPDLAFLDCGGVRLMLTRPSAPEYDHRASILYFPVADLEAAHEALRAAGVEVKAPPLRIARLPDHELWMCFFRDPSGNVHALMSEKPISHETKT